jgi:hypothetical protein
VKERGRINVSQIASSLLNRRYGITEAGLDMALTNVQNNSSRKPFERRLRIQTKRWRSEIVGETRSSLSLLMHAQLVELAL